MPASISASEALAQLDMFAFFLGKMPQRTDFS
jgi:hypothetical protein